MAGDEHGSLFEQLAAEAVGPLLLELPDPDNPDVYVVEWTVAAPRADGVCALDELTRPGDIVAELLDDDIADDVLDHLEVLAWSHTTSMCGRLRRHFALTDLPAGLWRHLVEHIDCYGEAIESDLADRSMDLLDWFRGARPWPQLARLLARLPEGSRYRAAILDDEDLAAERIAAGDTPADRARARPPLEGETQTLMLLRTAVSQLLRVEHAVYAVAAPKGKAGRPPRPLPGPETAEDRLRDRYADAEVEEIFDHTVPGWRGDDPVDRADPPRGFSPTSSGLLVPDDA